MSEDETYNGWTNYETWIINLHLMNDPVPYELVREMVNEWWDGEHVSLLGDHLKENLEMMLYVDDSPLATDLLRAALGRVNWLELAEIYVSDFREPVAS